MRNLKIYFALTLLNNFWFITSNWLNFWLKYMTLKEVGIIDGIAFLIGILFEFPSGVISDKLGRKNSLILAQLLQFAGSFIISFATNLYEIGIGFIVFQIGVSMYSGSIESFGYEVSNQIKYDYVKTLSISSFLNNFGYLFSLLVGGYLYIVNQNLPNYLFTLNFFIGIFLSYFILESRRKIEDSTNQKNELRYHLNSEKSLVQTFKSLNYKILLYMLTLSAMAFAFDFGFLKLILVETFSNINDNYWYIFSFTLVSLLISYRLLIQKINELLQLRVMFVLLLTFVLLTYIIANTTWVLFGYLTFLAIYLNLLSLNYFNNLVSDSNRASFLSLFAFGYKLPYVFLALVLGEMLMDIKITSLSYPTFLILCALYLIGKLGYNRAVLSKGA